MSNNIIRQGNSAFRISAIPKRYKANCDSNWGCWITGDCNVKELNISKAEKAGKVRGEFIELALCWIGNKVLTFEPNYINEQFAEVWGFPVAGQIKEELPPNASQLITFLLHRQSKDKLLKVLEEFEEKAFSAWVTAGMIENENEYMTQKKVELYFGKIFRFELKETNSKIHGKYFFVDISLREPANDFEREALETGKQLFQMQNETGDGFCIDPMLELNHNQNLALAGTEVMALPETTKDVKQKVKR